VSSAQNDSAEPQPIDPRTLLGINSFGQPIWRAVVQAGLFFTVAGLGVSMALGQPPKPELGWSIALLGAVAGVVLPGLATFGGRRRVELFEEGFVVRSMFHTRQHRWTEVSDFVLATMLPGRGMRQTYVVYDAEGDRGILIRLNRFLSGRGRSLPIGLEPAHMPGNAVTVALTLNAWRERAIDKANAGDG
jgi:hypothetical protein